MASEGTFLFDFAIFRKLFVNFRCVNLTLFRKCLEIVQNHHFGHFSRHLNFHRKSFKIHHFAEFRGFPKVAYVAGPGHCNIKLALLGVGHPVDLWGLPTRPEWALIPDRGIMGHQTGSVPVCVAFGRPQGSWLQELKSSSPADFLLVVEAGGRSPGRSFDRTTQRLTVHIGSH